MLHFVHMSRHHTSCRLSPLELKHEIQGKFMLGAYAFISLSYPLSFIMVKSQCCVGLCYLKFILVLTYFIVQLYSSRLL